MVGAVATIYVWFLDQIYVNKSWAGTVATALVVTGSVFRID